MKILGVHYFFPPTRVVASRRLWYFYQNLARQLDEDGQAGSASIHIITSAQAKDWPQEARYAHAWQLHHVAGKGLREHLAGNGSTSIQTSVKVSKFYQWAAAIRHSYPFLYLTDEGGPRYRQAAYDQAVRLIEANEITHLVSSYRPWVDHLVAAKLKNRFPQLIWLADFRDLPVDPIRRDVWWPGLQKAFARRIIRKADYVMAVSEGQAEQLRSLGKSVSVVYSGLDKLPELTQPTTEEFVINYTGSIYPSLQSLAPLGEALQTLLSRQEPCYFEVSTFKKHPLNIKLHYAGKDASVFRTWAQQYNLLAFCEIKNVISQAEAQAQQNQAAVNVLLSWSAPNYYGVLTAKLYDYLAAGRPILALVNGPQDLELSKIVEGSRAGRCFHADPRQVEGIKDWLAVLYTNWQQNDGRLAWKVDVSELTYLLSAVPK